LNVKHRILICLLLLLCLPGFTHSTPEDDLKQYVFKRLESVRLQKKEQLLELFRRIEKQAAGAKTDRTLLTFFHTLNRDKALLDPKASVPPALRAGMEKYQQSMLDYYLNAYLDFYDILLVDKDGFVFYSMRKEPDYRTNILTGALAGSRLAACLKTPEEEFFVDFQYYSPADEPAAFFLNRVYKDGEHQGWIIMQFALNMLNALLVDYSELGETGEVYIVNRDLLMLTDSRFAAERTRLKKRIDTEAVHDAFKNGAGCRLITGYRGVRVLTSYDTFDLWGSRWAIIASIEEDEIITMHFSSNRAYYTEKLYRFLNASPPPAPGRGEPFRGKTVKVDMDEYARALPGAVLATRGVSACTAVAICCPGRFGYMAHISPRDKIYGKDNLTHLLKDMMRNIQYYEIHLNEIPLLRVTVVANHLSSLGTILEKLLASGLHLSQITFLYSPRARYANVSFDCKSGSVIAEWMPEKDGGAKTCQPSSGTEDLGAVMKKIMGYGTSNKTKCNEG